MTVIAESHDELRPLMFVVAYRMLGSVAEAEDVVQEAFLGAWRNAARYVEGRGSVKTRTSSRKRCCG